MIAAAEASAAPHAKSAESKQHGSSFQLEALEPRLLLSADLACGAALASAAAITPHQTTIVVQQHEAVSGAAIRYDSAPGFSDIFGDVTGQELASPEQPSPVVIDPPSATC